MFILTFILYFIVAAHELVAPDDDFNDSVLERVHLDELTIIQLLGMFQASRGIVTDLPDGSFSATSELVNHNAIYARIGDDHVSGKAHGWCAAKGNGKRNSITVDLTMSYLVTGLATQGRGDADQWVNNYSVETSEDGHNWVAHGQFLGNFDRHTICRRRFDEPVAASFVRFIVIEFTNHPCMRVDVLVFNMADA